MNRFDRVDPPKNMSSKFEKTPEGHLKGVAPVCSIGVYQYMDKDGNVFGELRLPEEVFKVEFLDSLKQTPLTLYHPEEFVTADNVGQYKVGSLGTGIKTDDGIHVAVDMVIEAPEAIKAIISGIQEISVGYTCDLEPSSGVYLGSRYDFIQRNLKANHVSIVPAARGGETLRIRLDSADSAVLVRNSEKEATMPELKTVKLDGVDYQAEAEVLKVLHVATEKVDAMQNEVNTVQAKFDALIAEKSQLEAEKDTLKDRCDGLDAKVKELENARMDEATLKAAVDRRVKILDAAKTAKVEIKDGMTEVEIQKAVIVSVFPKASLDGKDDKYIDARFDGAIEAMELQADAVNRQIGSSADTPANTDAAPSGDVVSSAYEKYIATLQSGWKVKEA
jgi:hypothetical protein